MMRFTHTHIFFLIIILILVIFGSCNSVSDVEPELDEISLGNGQTLEQVDDSSLSSDEHTRLQTIAEKLAVRYVNEQSPEETEIPSKVVSFFYSGLVYLEKSDLEEAKTVTDEYSLMARNPANPREVLLWAFKSEPWLDNWREEKTETGVEEIDNLIEQFDLSLKRYRELDVVSPGAIATLEAGSPINGYAVGKEFASLEMIEKGATDAVFTGGRNVGAQIKSNYLLLDVTVGSGDCPAGCINKITHKFGVYSDGKVKLMD